MLMSNSKGVWNSYFTAVLSLAMPVCMLLAEPSAVKYFVLCCDFVINLFNSQLKHCRASACCFGIWDPTRLLN